MKLCCLVSGCLQEGKMELYTRMVCYECQFDSFVFSLYEEEINVF